MNSRRVVKTTVPTGRAGRRNFPRGGEGLKESESNAIRSVSTLLALSFLVVTSGASALEIAMAVLEPPRGSVALNEVVPDNESTLADEFQEYDDWIELYNLSDQPIDLGGLYLTDTRNDLTQWMFPPGTALPGGGFVIVWCDRQPQQGDLHTNFSLSAAGEQILLVDRDGLGILDVLEFSAVATDEAIGRLPDGTGTFFYLDRATPGASNSGALAQTPTPSLTPTPAPVPPVAINEFMAINDSTIADGLGQFDDWIELYNPAAQGVNLGGLYLSDDPDLLTRWQFPANTILDPGDFVLVWCDGQVYPGELHASFALSSTGEDVFLVDRDGQTILDTVSFGIQSPDVSMGRVPDGTGPLQVLSTASPGTSNNLAPTVTPSPTPSPSPTYTGPVPPVVINEFMASNFSTILDDQGDYDDWIELYNMGLSQVDLSGFLLSDDPSLPAKWRFPAGTTLAPGQFLLVWADNDSGPGILHATFALSAGGEHIVLSTPDGVHVVDSVTFGALGADQALGRLPDGLGNYFVLLPPTPGASNNQAQTPTPSPTPSPTPTPGPGLAPVVINEIMTDNLSTVTDEYGDYDDWIEFYNTGDSTFDLGGLGLSDDPTSPGKFVFPAGTLLEAKGFLLVWADGEPLEGPLHAPFGVSRTGEELILTAADGLSVIDYQRFGALPSDHSSGRYPDGTIGFYLMNRPTPGAANQLGPTPTPTAVPTPVTLNGLYFR